MKKRLLSLLLCLSMILQFVPTMAMATDGVQICTHHVHDDSCGYAAAVDGAPCAHVHDEICGYAEAVEEVLCACTTTDESGMLLHEEGCGYLPAVPASDCTHAHDEVCGYAEMIPGQPCTFHCDECLGHDHGEEEILPPEEIEILPPEEIEPPVVEPEESAPECTCESEDPEWHAPFCDAYVAPEKPECFCVELCGEEGINEYCDICWFDPEACAASGEEQAAEFASGTYISKIAVAYGAKASTPKDILKNNGFTLIDKDLNAGCGSTTHYIYMGYKTTTNPKDAITGIFIRDGGSPPNSADFSGVTAYLLGGSGETNPGENKAVDLNIDAGGATLHVYVTRDSSRAPITEIQFSNSNSKSGYTTPNVDLNRGASGEYIYLHYKQYSANLSLTIYTISSSSTRQSYTFSKTITDHTQSLTKADFPSSPQSSVYTPGVGTYGFDSGKYSGMKLVGWRDDNTAAAPEYTSTPSVNLDTNGTVFRGIFQRRITLSFNGNGGSNAPAAQTVDQHFNITNSSQKTGNYNVESKTLTIPSTKPTHAGKCAFLGWSTGSGATSATYKPGDEITIGDNTTLYAVYDSHNDVNGFCSKCGLSMSEPSQVNGVYQIGNKAQLIWFMQHVNAGNRSANAELTADIDMSGINWTPIASTALYYKTISYADAGYTGTFDGNGYTISNLTIQAVSGDPDGSYGLFGTLSGTGTVKHLGIKNFKFTGAGMDTRVGAVVGQMLNGSKVENCFAITGNINTKVNTSNGVAGGIAGCNYAGTISGCLQTGYTISAGRAGGIVGDNNGDISSSDRKGTVKNCVTNYSSIASSDKPGTQTGCLSGVSTARLASGEATWLLNGNSSSGVWKQTVGLVVPAFSGETVYYGYTCGVSGKIYANSPLSANPLEHDYANGFCGNCGGYQPAQSVNGVYQITNGGNLFWFAEHVNTTDKTASAKLTADIDLEDRPWTPIGVEGGADSHSFRGVFDGNGKTIRGLYVDAQRHALGLFGEVRDGTVKNFTIHGEVRLNGKHDYIGGVIGSACGTSNTVGATISGITSYVDVILGAGSHGSNRVAGLIGYVNHNTVVENCVWYGTLDLGPYRAQDGVGGLVGKANSDYTGIIRNCAAYGTIKTAYQSGSYSNFDTIYIGGIVSNSVSGAQTRLENCVWGGTIEDKTNLGAKAHIAAFGTLSGIDSVTNCYALDNAPYIITNNAQNAGIATVTAEQMASGEVAYSLGAAWGQAIGSEALPLLGGEKIYRIVRCTGAVVYSNTAEADGHNFDKNGFCFYCGGYQPAEQDESGVYLIGNAGQLYWFAQQVNDGSTDIHGALTADITVNARVLNEDGSLNGDGSGFRVWTPIGSEANKFTDTFDGRNHTVSGLYFKDDSQLYVGLFGNAAGTIGNVGIVDSYFYGKNYVGGVVGYADNGSIENCYNTGIVTGKNYVGGVVGNADNSTVTNCYNTGAVSGSEAVGGVAGDAFSGTVRNCYNTGIVTGSNYVGGVAGDGYKCPVENCYNTGTVSGSNFVGGVVGYAYNGTVTNCYNTGAVTGSYSVGAVNGAGGTVTNCYYLDTCGGEGEGTAKTAAQFASGEVAWLLGEAFKQTIGTDETPNFTGETVYQVTCGGTGTAYNNTNEDFTHNYVDNVCTICGTLACGTLVVEHTVSSDLAADMAMSFRYTVTLDNGKTYTFELKAGETSEPLEIPGGTGYEITWEAVEGFTVTGSAEGTIVAKQETTATICWARAQADLIIEAYAESLQNTSFTFTVTLADSTINGTYGHLTFDNGVSTFTLKHGESMIGAILPAGIGYTVTTTASDETYIITKAEDNGAIKVGGSTVVFTFSCNHYFDPNNNYQCANCGTQMAASVTIGGTTEGYLTLDAATQAVEDCTAEDNAVVALLTDIERSEALKISGGVFTFDLNGKTLFGTNQYCFLTITGGTVTIADSSAEGTGTITGTGTLYGMYVRGSTVNITGGSISGVAADILNHGTVLLTLADNKTEGASFPGGIQVGGTTLQAILGVGAAYWQNDMQLVIADDVTEIEDGDVVIKAVCGHSGSMDDGDCTTAVICSNCKTMLKAGIAAHSFGTDNKCTNEGCTAQAAASITADGTTTPYATLQAAAAAAQHGDTITMLADVEMTETLTIERESNTDIILDLNGKTVKVTAASGDGITINYVNLEVKDSIGTGKLIGESSEQKGKGIYFNESSLELHGGTIEATGDQGTGIYFGGRCVLVVHGGTIEATGATAMKKSNVMWAFDDDIDFLIDETTHVKIGKLPYVARLGDTKYLSLDAAITAAQNGNTIVMLDNVTLNETLNINKNITLDLNGKTVKVEIEAVAGNVNTEAINVTGDLTVIDSSDAQTGVLEGVVDGKESDYIRNLYGLNVTGTLTVESGTVKGTATDKKSQCQGMEVGDLTVTGGSVIGNSTSKNSGSYGVRVNNTLTVEGGSVTANGGAGALAQGVDVKNLIVKGGTVKGIVGNYGTGICVSVNGTVTITGGSVIGEAAEGAVSVSGIILMSPLTMSGGTMEGTGGTNGKGIFFSKSYSFTNDIAVVEGKLNSGDHAKIAGGSVAKIGDQGYATLQAAANAVQDGETITMLADVELNERLEIDTNITLDLGGKTVKVIQSDSYGMAFCVEGDLTVRDTVGGGSLIGETALGAGFGVSVEGDLTVESGAVIGAGTGSVSSHGIYVAGDLIVRGGTVEGTATDETDTGMSVEGEVVFENGIGYLINERDHVKIGRIEAKIGEQGYKTLAEAIAAAADGQTIELQNSCEIDLLVLRAGTLDLNGYTVSAGRVVTFSGSHIIDTQNGKGRLDVDADKILLPETNSYLPIKTQRGYAFIALTTSDFNEALQMEGSDPKYAFQPLFKDDAIHSLLMAADSGVEMEVRVDWSKDDLSGTYQFVYNRDMMEDFLNSYNAETERYGKMFTIKLNNTEGFSSLEMYAVVSSDLGVDACANGGSMVRLEPIME